MNLKILVGLLILILAGLTDVAYAEELNTLSDKEKKAGWRLLFDGQTTAGWRGYRSKTMPRQLESGEGFAAVAPSRRASPGAISSPSSSSTILSWSWNGR